MKARTKATVYLADPEEVVRVETDSRDRRAFERDGRQALKLPAEGTVKDVALMAPERYVAFVVWHALRREGLTDLGFATWETSRLVEVVEDEAELEPDPTRPAR